MVITHPGFAKFGIARSRACTRRAAIGDAGQRLQHFGNLNVRQAKVPVPSLFLVDEHSRVTELFQVRTRRGARDIGCQRQLRRCERDSTHQRLEHSRARRYSHERGQLREGTDVAHLANLPIGVHRPAPDDVVRPDLIIHDKDEPVVMVTVLDPDVDTCVGHPTREQPKLPCHSLA